MTILLADAPAIPGLRFRGLQRPADDATIARLVDAGIAAVNIPHRLSQAQITSWLDHPSNLDLAADLIFAEVNGSIVGYTEGGWEQDNDGGATTRSRARCTPTGSAVAWGLRRGWVSSVGVRRAWRRRGIARALVAESLRVLRDAGMTSAGLGVDAENANGALGVYEATGFGVVLTDRVYRKPL